MPLSDAAIRNAKGTGKPYKLSDSGGLYVLVTATGSRLWRWKYRFNGKEKVLSIGPYPAVTLAGARNARDAAKANVISGLDPTEVKRETSRKAELDANNTFRAVAEEYVAKLVREGRAEATIKKTHWLLSFAYNDLGNRPISSISPVIVLEVLRRIEARGTYETARRLRSKIGAVFRYAIATARAETDPTFALRGALTAPVVKNRAAIVERKPLGGLLRAIEGYEGQPTTAAALKLMALLFPRPGELRLAYWAEFDLEGAVWTIPSARTKMRRVHKVPLPIQAIAILRQLHQLTGLGKLVFPGTRSAHRPISENTLNAGLRRLGYSKDDMTSHGFRATAATLLNESGKWHADAIERQLGHEESNDVRRAYTRGEHWDERVQLMQWWADLLDSLREGGKVIKLKRDSK